MISSADDQIAEACPQMSNLTVTEAVVSEQLIFDYGSGWMSCHDR